MRLQFLAAGLLALCASSFQPLVAAQEEAKWGYKSDKASTNPAQQDDSSVSEMLSPANWGHSYPSCNGKSQSPIDILVSKGCKIKEKAPLSFSGDCSSYGLRQFEETFKWMASNTTCKVHKGGKAYSLLQFHMHMPSEHRLSGKKFEAETHFVHQEDGGDKLLVIGMFIDKAGKQSAIQTKQHPWIDTVWGSLGNVNATVQVAHSYADLLVEKMDEGNVFNYPGSLTTPPCSEGVDWWVIKSPLYATEDSLKKFKKQLTTLEATDEGEAARPVQPLNGREVVMY